jgi:hypothetical protein
MWRVTFCLDFTVAGCLDQYGEDVAGADMRQALITTLSGLDDSDLEKVCGWQYSQKEYDD